MTSTDVTFVFQHFSNPDVGPYLLDDDPVTTLEQAQAQAIVDLCVSTGADSYNRWILERRAGGCPIGTFG